uniref:Retrotransposon gag domain-containing protein n=1 Tax=Cyprinus carpio carpio TaxID=630221 RepID=A0A9J7Z1R4_CYPCA
MLVCSMLLCCSALDVRVFPRNLIHSSHLHKHHHLPSARFPAVPVPSSPAANSPSPSGLLTVSHHLGLSSSLHYLYSCLFCLVFIKLSILALVSSSSFTESAQNALTIKMEAASTTSLTDFIHHSVNRMDQQQESITNTGRAIQALVAQVSELTQQIHQLHRISPTAPAPPVPREIPQDHFRPEPRLPAFCRTFLNKCSMHFALQPRTFATEESKVAFTLTLLSGKAALWGTAVWENQHSCCASFHTLSEEMRRVFDRAAVGREAAQQLSDLHQGTSSFTDYSIQFRTLAAACQWNEAAQWDRFLHGLADRVQKEIYLLELPPTLNGLIDLALRVDARINRLGRQTSPTRHPISLEKGRSSRENAVGPVDDHEPMQVGRAWLPRRERERRRSQGLCLYCGGSGHTIAAETAFTNLKSRFVSAPILVAPDPTWQFVVEVDASEVGVGAVLSQRAASDDKVHPCAFFFPSFISC